MPDTVSPQPAPRADDLRACTATIDPDCAQWLQASGLRPLRLRGRTLLPIVQGGLGVGVSAHKLAGTVASLGGIGTISSVDLRRHQQEVEEQLAATTEPPIDQATSAPRAGSTETPPSAPPGGSAADRAAAARIAARLDIVQHRASTTTPGVEL